eukprot:scaffold139007_cov81-Phaeocystis_antarctica.AAC.1
MSTCAATLSTSSCAPSRRRPTPSGRGSRVQGGALAAQRGRAQAAMGRARGRRCAPRSVAISHARRRRAPAARRPLLGVPASEQASQARTGAAVRHGSGT